MVQLEYFVLQHDNTHRRLGGTMSTFIPRTNEKIVLNKDIYVITGVTYRYLVGENAHVELSLTWDGPT